MSPVLGFSPLLTVPAELQPRGGSLYSRPAGFFCQTSIPFLQPPPSAPFVMMEHIFQMSLPLLKTMIHPESTIMPARPPISHLAAPLARLLVDLEPCSFS